MHKETKQCKNCNSLFVIEVEDFKFYAKIDVPPPTLCPDCRYQRRLAHRNERTLYQRKCSATGKQIVSIYPSDTLFPVYEQKYWNEGNWDALTYGREFDFSRPFFEQFHELQQVVPRVNLRDFESVDSHYLNQSYRNKSCYLLVASNQNENVMYSNWAQHSRDSLDVYNLFKGEWSYEAINCQLAHNLLWCMQVENSFSCWFCYDLKDCNNCFLSSNLRNKSYYWESKPLTKEEYFERFQHIQSGSYKEIETLKTAWHKLRENSLHRFALQKRVQDVSGDTLFEAKNVHQSFNVTKAENCKYCQDIVELKDHWDSTECGFRSELSYETHGSATLSHCISCSICQEGFNLLYCDLCNYSSNLFGCIALKHKKYCILNKQYSKESFDKLKNKIIAHMKKTGEWGEFFPTTISPFCYNETTALEYFPMSKEEVLTKGWRWSDNLPGTYDKGTIDIKTLPDDITEARDTIIKEILTCAKCGRNYRILPQELAFYRKLVLPLPRQCPNCRHYARLALRNPRKLWHRQCRCEVNSHEWHTKKRCPNEFETSYAPNRPEVVYCEKCYQQEIV